MKFMAIEPFYFGNSFHDASASNPFLFDLADDEVPNVKWYPLDEKAEKALKALADAARKGDDNKGNGPRLVIHGIPDMVVPEHLPQVRRPPPEQEVFGKPNRPPETVKIVKNGRVADQEPGK